MVILIGRVEPVDHLVGEEATIRRQRSKVGHLKGKDKEKADELLRSMGHNRQRSSQIPRAVIAYGHRSGTIAT